MTYEECGTLVDAYSSAVMLSKSADLEDEDRAEAATIRDSLGEFISSLLFRYFEDKES